MSMQAQSDVHQLLAAGGGGARFLLNRRGSFLPLVFVLTLTSDIAEAFVVHTGVERPLPTDLIDELTSALRLQRESLRAFIMAVDVRYEGNDAVRLTFEHREGSAATFFMPYKKVRRWPRRLEISDDLESYAETPSIWPPTNA